jgi:hypothetical protein
MHDGMFVVGCPSHPVRESDLAFESSLPSPMQQLRKCEDATAHNDRSSRGPPTARGPLNCGSNRRISRGALGAAMKEVPVDRLPGAQVRALPAIGWKGTTRIVAPHRIKRDRAPPQSGEVARAAAASPPH